MADTPTSVVASFEPEDSQRLSAIDEVCARAIRAFLNTDDSEYTVTEMPNPSPKYLSSAPHSTIAIVPPDPLAPTQRCVTSLAASLMFFHVPHSVLLRPAPSDIATRMKQFPVKKSAYQLEMLLAYLPKLTCKYYHGKLHSQGLRFRSRHGPEMSDTVYVVTVWRDPGDTDEASQIVWPAIVGVTDRVYWYYGTFHKGLPE
ncbi:MAG: hypothetical protein M1836_000652 [Candelina mexicana]|nr:MAG: hypothetical protein M1836_000652 [Candelina mexicana]